MNPAQFPNPGGGMPGVVKPNMPPQQNKEGAQLIMGHVAQILANQGPFGGWKADVPIKTRAMNVYQMYVVIPPRTMETPRHYLHLYPLSPCPR
jgi:hypothetical protein